MYLLPSSLPSTAGYSRLTRLRLPERANCGMAMKRASWTRCRAMMISCSAASAAGLFLTASATASRSVRTALPF